uniref:WD_REPEATS_REGION domain-containing protein n=1 Tax=Panagrellus redivivus TaxID=6233 RepID=A0A7E4UVF1_PANRE
MDTMHGQGVVLSPAAGPTSSTTRLVSSSLQPQQPSGSVHPGGFGQGQQQHQQQQILGQAQFQPNFACYEALTSPPEQHIPSGSVPGPSSQSYFGQNTVPNSYYIPQGGPHSVSGHLNQGDIADDPAIASYSMADASAASSSQQPTQPFYYYHQPTTASQSASASGYEYSQALRPMSGANSAMSGIQTMESTQQPQTQYFPPPVQPIPQQQQQQPSQQASSSAAVNNGQKHKEIYRYQAPHTLYACAWSSRPEPQYKFRLAVGSFVEEYNNKISLIQLREESGDFVHLGSFDHPYPSTRIHFIPDSKGIYPDLIATAGDYLRLWRVGGNSGATLEVMLNNNRNSDYCAPLTSSDWNETDVSLIGTSSIDTTCTIWQIETGQAIANTSRAIEGTVKTQLIAHDKEVYDIAFSKLASGREIFASAGADGSVRMFDLRHMEYSTIVFEEPNRRPLLRLAWNRQEHNQLATFARDSNEVYILDVRMPSLPTATLKNHSAAITGIAWAPHSQYHMCTTGDDAQALIWDLHSIPRPIDDPILSYSAGGEVNHVGWSSLCTNWISICYANSLELLRV